MLCAIDPICGGKELCLKTHFREKKKSLNRLVFFLSSSFSTSKRIQNQLNSATCKGAKTDALSGQSVLFSYIQFVNPKNSEERKIKLCISLLCCATWFKYFQYTHCPPFTPLISVIALLCFHRLHNCNIDVETMLAS